MIRRLRPLLRAAAVGGTAYAVGRRSGRQREEQANYEADQDQRIADLEQQQQQAAPPPPPPPAPAPAAQPSMLDQLNQLTDLHTQGALSDEEFTAAKAKLLG
jgi:hypothetical protein